MSKLRRVRLEAGKGLNEVAREAGLAPSCLSRLERGLSRSTRHAEIMARYWGGAVTELEILYPRRYGTLAGPLSRGRPRKDCRAA